MASYLSNFATVLGNRPSDNTLGRDAILCAVRNAVDRVVGKIIVHYIDHVKELTPEKRELTKVV